MRIGIDIRLWNETGVGRYIRNLVENILAQDMKNEYTLFTKSLDIKHVESVIPRGKRFRHRIVPADISWHSFNEQLSFYLLLNKQSLDLIHFPYISIPILYKKPFVVTIHDLIVHHFSTGKATTLPPLLYKVKRLGYDQVIKHAVFSSRKIIVPLEATKQDLIASIGVDSKKIEVTGEGFDSHLKSNPEADEFVKQHLTDNKYFMYVGNAYPHKNIERLVNIFLEFCKKSTCKLVLVGKEDAFYNKLKDTYKSDSLLFLHNIPDSHLASLYKHATAYISPSLIEGFGLPILEAMSLSCLVVVSRIPAHQEVCRDAAIFFEPQDSESMAKALHDTLALENSKKTWYIKQGKIRASAFSWKAMAEKTISIYESCNRIRPD